MVHAPAAFRHSHYKSAWRSGTSRKQPHTRGDQVTSSDVCDHNEVSLRQGVRTPSGGEYEATNAWILPGDSQTVTLQYTPGRVVALEGAAARWQFLGRYYVKRIQHVRPDLRSAFARVGDVFWFDQFRNLGTLLPEPDRNGSQGWTRGRQG